VASSSGDFSSLFGTFGSSPTSTGSVPSGSSGSSTGSGTSSVATAAATQERKLVDQPLTKSATSKMPVLLAILAILALSLVTATYARLYLLRREG
jgi:cobalamin biosynthesis Mg chelatase CobN